MARVTAVERRRELGQQFRVDSIRMSSAAKSGHPTSAMSAADLVAVLVDGYLRYDFSQPKSPTNDRLVFSKGHASTLLYAIYRAAGVVSDEELMAYRKLGSKLEGHPTPVLPWVDVATGSLGQGLPIGVGMALAGKYLEHLPNRVWVLCGDSEMAEGSMWEAFEHAAHFELDNLTAIIDVNRLGQRGETMVGWDLDVHVARAEAFGWNAIEVDGHDVEAIDEAFGRAVATTGKPTVVVARTKKGKGVSAVEDVNGFHGKPLDDPEAAIAELGGLRDIRIEVAKPDAPLRSDPSTRRSSFPATSSATEVATRKAYGDALAALGSARPDVVVLDGEVSNSTFAETFAKAHPERYFEMYIAEQQMVAAAVGLQAVGWRPFASTFAAFLSRAYDFIRMAAVSRATLLRVRLARRSVDRRGRPLADGARGHRVVPCHPRLDGAPSVRREPNRTARRGDGRDGRHLVPAHAPAGDTGPLPARRGVRDRRRRVLRSSDSDEVTLIGAGITVHEALKAADTLAEEGIAARVIDLYSIKPLDAETLQAAAEATGGRLVTVEDHWPEGGLGEAVLAAVADADEPPRVVKLAVHGMPTSGKPEELLAAAGIDAASIADAARRLVAQTVQTA